MRWAIKLYILVYFSDLLHCYNWIASLELERNSSTLSRCFIGESCHITSFFLHSVKRKDDYWIWRWGGLKKHSGERDIWGSWCQRSIWWPSVQADIFGFQKGVRGHVGIKDFVKKTKIAVCHLLPFKILCTEHQAYFLSYIHLLLAQCKTAVDICLPNWQWGTEAHVWVRWQLLRVSSLFSLWISPL